MKHIPHMVVGAPWDGPEVTLSVVQWRHITKVLRLKRGDPVSYTDGLGTTGEGTLGEKTVARGDEHTEARVTDLWVAVAPPANKDRQRFLVEKLAELGVSRLLWLKTAHGKGRVAAGPKLFAWVLSAVEQSRGAWLMETSPDLVEWADLNPPVVACHPGGTTDMPSARTVVIGPEGGFAEGEIPGDVTAWSLGSTVLRVETAAMVAAVRLLG